ncbi:Na+/H+ antiporter NhaA [Amycolatopsis sp. NPDC023774]|uniref:Na+/H+ antiporter NhaA n=1 Tax=Amycolatopsis sp. NPDC023774 TaxID=3155015 RepID=UPI003404BFE2
MIVVALGWANLAPGAYDAVWNRVLSVRIGPLSAAPPVRDRVNSGLGTLFFSVVGLEARRGLSSQCPAAVTVAAVVARIPAGARLRRRSLSPRPFDLRSVGAIGRRSPADHLALSLRHFRSTAAAGLPAR